jgi:hypothetical protein
MNLPAWLKPALTQFAAPALLRKTLRLNANTYLSTVISDGEQPSLLSRDYQGKVTTEKQ